MKIVHVAVGVIIDEADRVLISLRPQKAHQGGLWEFPGGKCEEGERIEDALWRELDEELGIQVLDDAPLCKIQHDYGDKRVLLEVRRVLRFAGTPIGREGQLVRWSPLTELNPTLFPVANRAIIRRIQLPDHIAITGTASSDALFEEQFTQLVAKRPPLIQFRQKHLNDDAFQARAQYCLALCRARGIPLVFNTEPERFAALGGDGLHISSSLLQEISSRPVDRRILFGASCHSLVDLKKAEALEADYAFLSPVAATRSHPGQPALGWEYCEELIRAVDLPIYALGGMQHHDITRAIRSGAAGIAAISAFWSTPVTL